MSKMPVFLSWSGNLDQFVASAFKTRLERVLGEKVSPFFSPHMQPGTPPIQEITRQMAQSDHGLLFLTRENAGNSWILYEAGAVGKRIDKSKVYPILLDLPFGELRPPLQLLRQARHISDLSGIQAIFLEICKDADGDSADQARVLDGLELWLNELNKSISSQITVTLAARGDWQAITQAKVAPDTADSPFQAEDALRIAKKHVVFTGQNLFSLIKRARNNGRQGYWQEIQDFLTGQRLSDGGVTSTERVVDILVLDPKAEGGKLVDAWAKTIGTDKFRDDIRQCLETLPAWQEAASNLEVKLNIKLAQFIPLSMTFVDADDLAGDGKLFLRAFHTDPKAHVRPVVLLTKRDNKEAFKFYWHGHLEDWTTNRTRWFP